MQHIILKDQTNSVEVHPQLSNNGHPVDGVLVGAGSLWPWGTAPCTNRPRRTDYSKFPHSQICWSCLKGKDRILCLDSL
jgi:hypothetical protein